MNKKKMALMVLALIPALTATLSASGGKDLGADGEYALRITPGEEWIHSFSALIKVPPQYALWIEDSSGKYLETLFVTKKAATEGWAFNRGNRRDEALPWSIQPRGLPEPPFPCPSYSAAMEAPTAAAENSIRTSAALIRH